MQIGGSNGFTPFSNYGLLIKCGLLPVIRVCFYSISNRVGTTYTLCYFMAKYTLQIIYYVRKPDNILLYSDIEIIYFDQIFYLFYILVNPIH